MLILGILFCALGAASLLGLPLAQSLTYPLLWWGMILILDAVNFKKWGSSLIRGQWKFFLGIIIPFSVIYWLFFEFVNFAFPQWHYAGIIGPPWEILLTFISFATVIPAVVEIVWLFEGGVPSFQASGKAAFVSVLLGLLFTLMPFLSRNFWLDQLVWLVPVFLFAPFLDLGVVKLKSWLVVGTAGLLSGFLWELFNFHSAIKWKYDILLNQPHLFEMPVLGYLGFIPFAFSTAAAYLFARKFFKANVWVTVSIYAAALLLSYFFNLQLA